MGSVIVIGTEDRTFKWIETIVKKFRGQALAYHSSTISLIPRTKVVDTRGLSPVNWLTSRLTARNFSHRVLVLATGCYSVEKCLLMAKLAQEGAGVGIDLLIRFYDRRVIPQSLVNNSEIITLGQDGG
jgi:hypothetical protein